MPRIRNTIVQKAAKRHWFSPGMVVAAVLVYVLYLLGVSAATWWVWVLAIVVSIVVDAIMGVQEHEVIKTKTTKEYGRGVQEDDDGVV